ncbi:hypothetical protein [uncultured Gimesia sp.]|uniref:hypothetical protein n=1 Tax=uncultured Gimesia sp. TaxID=1678688 RepID=UPI0026048ADB|nr:hypothetical protein [uncultured Gimesia sp.]
MKTNLLRSENLSRRKRLFSCLALIGGLVMGAQLIEPTTADAGYRYPSYRSSRGYNQCYSGYRQPYRNSYQQSYRGGYSNGSRYSGYRNSYRSNSNYHYRSNNRGYYGRY